MTSSPSARPFNGPAAGVAVSKVMTSGMRTLVSALSTAGEYAPSVSSDEKRASVSLTFLEKYGACWLGGVALNLFLSSPLLKTVLIAGRPIWSMGAPSDERSVCAHTPILPPSVVFGRSRTMAFVLSDAKKSTP